VLDVVGRQSLTDSGDKSGTTPDVGEEVMGQIEQAILDNSVSTPSAGYDGNEKVA
jgi:hypothetical protein